MPGDLAGHWFIRRRGPGQCESMHVSLSGVTSSDQSEPGSNANDGVLHIP